MELTAVRNLNLYAFALSQSKVLGMRIAEAYSLEDAISTVNDPAYQYVGLVPVRTLLEGENGLVGVPETKKEKDILSFLSSLKLASEELVTDGKVKKRLNVLINEIESSYGKANRTEGGAA